MPLVPFFFFNDPATTEIYTLSLHDALPISTLSESFIIDKITGTTLSNGDRAERAVAIAQDRKSTRLNSSHVEISYAVFCLKKKKKKTNEPTLTGGCPSAQTQTSCG